MSLSDLSYKNIVDGLPVSVFRFSAVDGKIIFANPALARTLGYSSAEILRLAVKDIVVNYELYEILRKQAIASGETVQKQLLFKTKHSRNFVSLLMLSAVTGQSRRVQYFDALLTASCNEQSVEKELTESKELFRVVFENSAAGITVTDKNERIVAWNPMAEKMLAMTRKDLFNKPVKDLYSPHEWRRMRAFRIRERGMLSDITTQIIRKDKSLLDVSVSISVLKNADGEIVGSIGILNDITQLKAIENKLRASETKMRVVLEHSPVGIMMADHEQRIVSWNPFAESLLGMNKKDLHLRDVSSLYPAEEWKKIRSENIISRGSRHHLETKILRKDNVAIDIDLSVNILRDDQNKYAGSIGIIQDITEQKKFRQMLLLAKLAAEEANNAKSLFLAKMSHEVRTPMNAVIGMLELTLDTRLSDEQRENLKVAKDAADNLLGLLNDILDLSKAEAGKITIEKVELNVHDLIKNVCRGLAILAQKRQIDLLWDIDQRIPKYLLGDPVRLRQIIINLVNNAIKFTHKGHVKVRAELMSIKENHCELLFIVEDTGIGIPAEKHETIFDLFTQADDHTTRKYGGTGLGLAICKKLVEMMDGRVWVESSPHKGSAFKFNIMFDVAPNQPLAAGDQGKNDPVVSHSSGAAGTASLNILVAEDNLVNQKIILKVLERKGWHATAVGSGREVLDRLEKQKFDLILMDDQMPELSGVDATRMIRAEEKQTGSHALIIAMTANAMAGDKEYYIKQGMDGYVSKPINREQLYAEVERVIKLGDRV